MKRSPNCSDTQQHVLRKNGAYSSFVLTIQLDAQSIRDFTASFPLLLLYLQNIMTMMMNATSTSPYEHGSSISTISSSITITIGNGSFPNEQLATLPFLQQNEPEHHQLTLQTAKAIVSSADTFERALKESGRSYDPNLPMQCAITNHTLSREIYAREQAEKRGYMYASFQNGIDREISKQQHQETMTCMKEEPGWSSELRDARDRCRGAISVAIIRGIVLVALTKLAPFLYLVFVLNEGSSLTVVAGEIFGTVSLE
jgi:hypothetical protein